jgi:hypothetical protein
MACARSSRMLACCCRFTGDTPRIGQKGLNEYWFPPDSPPTQITKLVVTPQSIGGDGQIAHVWGTDEVAWTTVQNGKTTSASHKICPRIRSRFGERKRRVASSGNLVCMDCVMKWASVATASTN